MSGHFRRTSGMLAALVLASTAGAEWRIPRVFSDNMVLQRDQPTPVWGWADPSESVTVTMGGQSKTAKAGPDGQWQVRLEPMQAQSTPRTLAIAGTDAAHQSSFTNVLVGDVWLCSGQSNMEWGMGAIDNTKEVLPTVTNGLIRLLSVKAPQSGDAVTDVPNGWTACDTQTIASFSAVGYFFGRTLQQETGVPIGLINNAWGGTAIEKWIPAQSLAAFPELEQTRQDYDKRFTEFSSKLAKSIDPVAQWVEKAREAAAKGERLPAPPDLPAHPAIGGLSGIFNGRVAPLIPFGIKGAIWYQGESNGTDDDVYYHKMRALIGSWRQAWGQGDFPFYFVQLANFQAATQDAAGGNGWAKIRMAQLKSLQIPKTGMAVTIDIGAANDIHPRNKEDVGYRLALWALRNDYGRSDLTCSGPLYKGVTVEGDKLRVAFDFAANGLMVGAKSGHGPATEVKDGKLQRFAVAGTNAVWHWADTVIDGPTVLVSSTNVPAPVAVRYAYSMNPEGANLYNREGLPASPFRSDTW